MSVLAGRVVEPLGAVQLFERLLRAGGRHVVESRTPFPRRRSWLATACEPAVVRRSLRVAAVVGTLLVAINYSDRALAGAVGPIDWGKMLLTYCVPYGVATYAAVQAMRADR